MAKYQWESDYYFRLGFWLTTPTADEIKVAYRTKIAEVHPDALNRRREDGDINAEEFAAKELLAKQLGEAYNVLSDSEQRAAYDAERKAHWEAVLARSQAAHAARRAASGQSGASLSAMEAFRRTSPPRAPTWQELAAQAVEAALRLWLASKI